MAEASEAGGVTHSPRHSRAGGNSGMLGWIPAFAGMTALVVTVAAHAQTFNAEQRHFLGKCNPQQKKELTRSCHCLMTSIDRALTLKEFNKLDERVNRGLVSDTELLQKAHLLALSKPAFRGCMGQ